ncbi:uncharacterized protein LOC123671694 [Harmonia axyridis]|uniref:uncharacterized protein LOC123671694 n=1 Tax=Harmonia axyridis TaxID=115357 RepID=UPI001E275DE4|nr:uncharacterized protein LOC123671694 [Harmonia axyridis]
MCALCCGNEEGYYHNFIGNVEFHMDDPWYNVRDLLRILKRMKRLDLAHPENRYKSLCWLNGMDCLVPYGPTCRFPCKDFYVTEARGCWGQALSQLKKNLADNCMIKFEMGRASPPRCGKKYRKSCTNDGFDCGGNVKCCSGIEDVCGPKMEECCDSGEPDCCDERCEALDHYCSETSELCDKCLGPEPPSCCPDWCGSCKVKKIPPESYKCYIKSFHDPIEKMIRNIEKRDCVFTRKSFENYYKVIWTKCKKKCDILEERDSEDFICDECCRQEQEELQYCCYPEEEEGEECN